MYERIARVLGWPVEETQQFSLQALRELVRPIDPKLTHELNQFIRSGAYILSLIPKQGGENG
jgi:hypothetical protein